MRAGTDAFLDGAVGSFDFANVAIGGDDLEMGRRKVGTYALKLLVTVNVTDIESAAGIETDDGL